VRGTQRLWALGAALLLAAAGAAVGTAATPALAGGGNVPAFTDGQQQVFRHFDCLGRYFDVADTGVRVGHNSYPLTSGEVFWGHVVITTTTASGCAGGAVVSLGVLLPRGLGLYQEVPGTITTRCYQNGSPVASGTDACPTALTAYTWNPAYAYLGWRTVPFGQTFEIQFKMAANATVTNGAIAAQADDLSALSSGTRLNASIPVSVTQPQAEGTRLTMAANRSAVAYGATVNLSGALISAESGIGLRGYEVYLYASTSGESTRLQTLTTGEGGAWAASVVPQANTSYVIAASQQVPGSEWHGTLASASVTVAQRVSASASSSRVKKGKYVSIGGTVSPDHRGKRVLLQQYVKAGWRTVVSQALTGASTYGVRLKEGVKGQQRYRVYAPADGDHAAGTSSTVVVTVV
jgi:hypothetical protein